MRVFAHGRSSTEDAPGVKELLDRPQAGAWMGRQHEVAVVAQGEVLQVLERVVLQGTRVNMVGAITTAACATTPSV
jgi:hypothetical protein